jgi:hypothetical protein
MGAQSIISPKPNRQNDKKPLPSIFSQKPKGLLASVILLYGYDGTESIPQTLSCQQLILFFSRCLNTSFLTEMAIPETMS